MFTLALASTPAYANRQDNKAALQKFVEARLAESARKPQLAADIYSDSLRQQPQNEVLAEKAYAKAVRIGDFDLGLVAAQKLTDLDLAKPEMALLFLADAYASNDWKAVQSSLETIDAEKNFAFMVPLLQTWSALRSNQKVKPYFDAAKENRTAAYYHDEQLVLILLSLGENRRALEVLTEFAVENPARSSPLRILSARHFLALKDRETALMLLQRDGSGPERILLRQIGQGTERDAAQRISMEIGIAFFFHRLATDLSNQSAQFLAQIMAQSAFRVAPDLDYSQLILGRSFADADEHDLAFDRLATVEQESPYFLAATSSATASLVAGDKADAALSHLDKVISSVPTSPELHILKGQTLQAKGEEVQAAQSFTKAIQLAEEANYSDLLLANYWLALGASQEQAGIWPDALISLKKANELRPNSPTILNYLGYAPARAASEQGRSGGIDQAGAQSAFILSRDYRFPGLGIFCHRPARTGGSVSGTGFGRTAAGSNHQ